MGKKAVYHPFFSKYIKHGEGKIILKKAGINGGQLNNWKNFYNTPNCKSIKWLLQAIAEHKGLDFNTLLVEYFKTV